MTLWASSTRISNFNIILCCLYLHLCVASWPNIADCFPTKIHIPRIRKQLEKRKNALRLLIFLTTTFLEVSCSTCVDTSLTIDYLCLVSGRWGICFCFYIRHTNAASEIEHCLLRKKRCMDIQWPLHFLSQIVSVSHSNEKIQFLYCVIPSHWIHRIYIGVLLF